MKVALCRPLLDAGQRQPNLKPPASHYQAYY
jgi:hypothetical protein